MTANPHSNAFGYTKPKKTKKAFRRKIFLFIKIEAESGEIKVRSFSSQKDAFDFMHSSPEARSMKLHVHTL